MAGDERGKDFVNVHHFGFVVDNVNKVARRLKENGVKFHCAPSPEMHAETKIPRPGRYSI